ncbi:hypothetical protein AAVH_08866 [Aphelenchoides avenae]|nr:hypothetical protein AAVH_08866 [Aphelenchus avenae]
MALVGLISVNLGECVLGCAFNEYQCQATRFPVIKCIPREWRCDGIVDCGQMDDELAYECRNVVSDRMIRSERSNGTNEPRGEDVKMAAVDVQAARADLKTASGLVQHGAVDQGLSHIFLYILVIMGYSPLIVVFLVSRFYGSEAVS